MPRLTWQALTLQLRNPFGLSYGTTETRQSFWLRLAEDAGWGEAAIPPYYGIPDADMIACWESAAQKTAPFPDRPEDVTAWVGDRGPAPARCALDLALHDRIALARRLPLYALLGLPEPPSLPTCMTIAIAAPEEMARLALEAANFSILKIKLGSDDDALRLAAVSAARPDALLRVDANAGWIASEARARLRELRAYRIELIEQPVAKDDFAGLAQFQALSDVPVIADESLRTFDDLERLARAGVRGINLKLQKVGGLAPALRILRRAQELGMQVMLGCMIESSLGVTAMAHLAGLADWLDLDAPLLIGNDPFDGVRFLHGGRVQVLARPGIGAVVRPG
jgi:L-Ala-D/L-Glu epimerase